MLVALAAGAVAIPASARCLTPNNVAIRAAFPDYGLWRPVARAMSECGNVETSFGFDATTAFSDSESGIGKETQIVGVSNGGLNRLIAQDAIRPLDDLVEKYRSRFNERQFVRVDGKIMAIAVAANAQVYAYHGQLFRRSQLEPPKSQADLFVLDEKIAEQQAVDESFSIALKPGWTATAIFLEMFLSTGNPLFNEENKPLIAGETGEKILAQLKKLAELSPPDPFEKEDSAVLQDLMRGRAASGILWASSTPALDKEDVSRVAGRMEFLPVPPVSPGGKPAAAVWWDGFAIARNASPEDAEAAFKTILEGLDSEMLETARFEAIWLMPEYEPVRLTRAVIDTIDAGAIFFPATRQVEILQGALAEHIGDYFSGKTEAAALLAQAEADYLRIARERGLPGL
jgi:ABC-type glycerol-3-phosphate transport system substrate-binding protein